MAPTLEQLVKVQSQSTTWLIRYLRSLMDLPNRDVPPYLAGRQLTDLYVPPDVQKVESRDGQDRGRTQRRGAASLVEEEQGRFWLDDDKRTRVAWERERKTIERAVILGRPGEGKTLLARMSVRTIAEASLTDLTTQQKGVRDVIIPVCVRLADVAEKGSVEAAVEAAVRIALRSAFPKEKDSPIIEAVVKHILNALFTDHCWLFLDALDEVPDRASLKASLEPLRDAGCHVVVTSRPYGYDSSVLPFASMTEYELAPFTPRQRRRFVGSWFKNEPTRRGRVLELAQGNPQFGDLTRDALLLTLTCATTEHHDLSPDGVQLF
jgi:predicted NACHT family NTPase